MADKNTPTPDRNTPTPDENHAAERARCAGIMRITRTLGLAPELAERAIADGDSEEAFRTRALDAYEQARPPIVSDAGRVRVGLGRFDAVQGAGDGGDFRAAARDALLLRAGVPLREHHPAARDISGSVHEIARLCVSRAGQTAGRGVEALIKRAQTTGDFSAILADATHKATRMGYETEPASHRAWVRVQEVMDFKDQNRPILGSAPDLEQVNEHGEYKDGPLDDDTTSYRVGKYGRIVSLSWETLVNDDVGAFLRVQPSMGQAARRKEADTVYDLFSLNSGAGPTMQDGTALFHADHGNLAPEHPSLDVTIIGVARALMRRQKAVGGGLLNLVPRFLIVPASLETQAEILLAQGTRTMARNATNTQETEGNVPESIARLELVVEARLADDAWYLAADWAQVDTCELGVLSENLEGPMIEDERDFRTDIYRWKVRHVIGAKVLDWRGMVKIPVSGLGG